MPDESADRRCEFSGVDPIRLAAHVGLTNADVTACLDEERHEYGLATVTGSAFDGEHGGMQHLRSSKLHA